MHSSSTPLSLTLFGSETMNKEEFVKIKVCDLRVSIHCDGCQKKVKKILHKIEGVYKTTIDSEQGKVTVTGDFDPDALIKKLAKHGKIAELWDAPKSDNNIDQNEQAIVKKSDSGKEGKKGAGPGQKGGNNQQQKPKSGQQQVPNQPVPQLPQQPMSQVPNQQQISKIPNQQQLQGMQQQVPNQQMKMPSQLNMPFGNGLKPNAQAAKLNGPKGGDLSGEDSDEYDEDDDESDEDDVLLPRRPNKMNPMMSNGEGGGQMPPNMIVNPGMNPGEPFPPHMMRAAPPGNGAPNGGNGAAKAKKGGGGSGNGPVPMNAGNANNGNGGKKGGGASGDGVNQISGAGGGGNIPVQVNAGSANDGNGGKKGGSAGANQNSGSGGKPANGNKNGDTGAQSKNGSGGQTKNSGGRGACSGNNANGEKKVVDNEVHVMPNMMGMGGGAGGFAGQMGNVMPMGQMAQMGKNPMEKMGQMGQMAAVQGFPATAPSGNYFLEAGPEAMLLNAYQQQQKQMAAMMMNQQRANDNERFQQMMYARPPSEVMNYMPPYDPSPYQQTPFTNYFSEENPTSCSIM